MTNVYFPIKSVLLPREAAIECLKENYEQIAEWILNNEAWQNDFSLLDVNTHNAISRHASYLYFEPGLTSLESFGIIYQYDPNVLSKGINVPPSVQISVLLKEQATSVLLREVDKQLPSCFKEMIDRSEPYEEYEWEFVSVNEIKSSLFSVLERMEAS